MLLRPASEPAPPRGGVFAAIATTHEAVGRAAVLPVPRCRQQQAGNERRALCRLGVTATMAELKLLDMPPFQYQDVLLRLATYPHRRID